MSKHLKLLKDDLEFEFSIDYSGDIEYVEPETNVNEEVLKYLVKNDYIPVNERTEGSVTIKMGIVYIDYRTCTQVGEDWDTDVWEEESTENLVLNMV